MVLIAIISALAIYGISKINLDEILVKEKYENIKLTKRLLYFYGILIIFFSLFTISFSWICIHIKSKILSFPIKNIHLNGMKSL